MSQFDRSTPPPVPHGPDNLPPPPPEQRGGCATAFMVLFGVILLLPGLCALLFAGGPLIAEGRFETGFAPFILVGLLVGFAGVMLIRSAIRGSRS